MESQILRDKFLDFFQGKGHKILPCDSLIPADDPTVLFTSAGMNQFKKQFLGQDIVYRRVATCQKCLRTDDLERVGKTSFHHTFFEMLGNFSFSDYFKQEAIGWAWEFLTEEIKIPEEKLWVSTYLYDRQSYDIWKNTIGISRDKIVELGDKENFWPSEVKAEGPNGPCGPCSEIFFDQGKKTGCLRPDCSPSCDCGRFVEVWNLVFTQFDRKQDGRLEDLPSKNIDTGMGLERLAAVMQGVLTSFQTDLFLPIIKNIEEIAQAKLEKRIGYKENFYAISDHIRAVTFAICDGVMPSNEGRGYVMRNLIRRSLQHARRLGINKPFLYKLVPSVVSTMHKVYPQLKVRMEDIAQIVKAEEEKFLHTLRQALPKLMESIKIYAQQGKCELPAQEVFKYRDTYGLPWDIIVEKSSQSGLAFDHDEVERLIKQQRARSKAQSAISDSIFTKERTFKGKGVFDRNVCELETKIVDIHKQEGKSANVEIVLEKTPFYPESGGQAGDSGVLKNKNALVKVYDTKKIGESIVHLGIIEKGEINIADNVTACIDKDRRSRIGRNHTATHLLQAALRKVLGEHIQQQGSLVCEDRLRFDFTHFKALTKQQLERVEEVVNVYIKNDQTVKTEGMPVEQARRSGALAFFGEKYSDMVRVVSVGDYSKELCGGTHIHRLHDIGLFKIVAEGSVASGVRRIEAVTGERALEKIKESEREFKKISQMLGFAGGKPEEKIDLLLLKVKGMGKRLSNIQLGLLKAYSHKIIKEARDFGGRKVIVKNMDGFDADSLRKTADFIRASLPNSIMMLTAVSGGKLFLVVGISEDLTKKNWDALEIIKRVAALVGGKGGGRSDFAQAGGVEPPMLKQAQEAFVKIVECPR